MVQFFFSALSFYLPQNICKQMNDTEDRMSVNTPTRSEMDTFRVMANSEYVDLKKPAPTSVSFHPIVEEDEHSVAPENDDADIYPDEAAKPDLQLPYFPVKEDFVDEDGNLLKEYQQERTNTTPVEEDDEDNEEPEKPQETSSSSSNNNSTPKKEPDFYFTQAKKLTDAEIVLEKEGLLLELQMMEKQGIVKLSRQFSMSDTLEELQFQVDRANSTYSTIQAVDLAKTGIRVGSTALEMLLKKLGIVALDGFSNNLCKDMNKFSRPLTKMYRKYWRRGGITSPETELMMILFGSMAMTVVQNKNLGGVGNLVSGMLGTANKFIPPVASQPSFSMPATNTASSYTPATEPPKINLKPPTIPAPSWASQPAATTVPIAPVVVPEKVFESTRKVDISTPTSVRRSKKQQQQQESSLEL